MNPYGLRAQPPSSLDDDLTDGLSDGLDDDLNDDLVGHPSQPPL